MKPLRDIWLDLVDRKLWPLAALLVIALVAVPVLVSRSASGGAGGSDVAAALPPAATPVVSTSQTSTTGGVYVGGRARDPFAQQHVPKPMDLSGPTASGLGPATAAIGSSGADASAAGGASSS